MPPDFADRLAAVEWSRFQTAYGRADDVPNQLLRLASPDKATALQASFELECGLCHQHVQLGTAALPALPFILEVMQVGDEPLVHAILDGIILGFAQGVSRNGYRKFQKGLGQEPEPDAEWVIALRTRLLDVSERFEALRVHVNPGIAEVADVILQKLSAGE